MPLPTFHYGSQEDSFKSTENLGGKGNTLRFGRLRKCLNHPPPAGGTEALDGLCAKCACAPHLDSPVLLLWKRLAKRTRLGGGRPWGPRVLQFPSTAKEDPSSPFWITDWFHLFISSTLSSSRTLRPFHWSPEATRVQLGQEQMVAQTVDGEDSIELWGPQGRDSPSGGSEREVGRGIGREVAGAVQGTATCRRKEGFRVF